MGEKVRTIRLYGTLGAQFGRVHRLSVSSTAEAVRAMCVILPGFERFMMTAKDNGLTFAVFNGRRNLAEGDLDHPVGDDDIRIAPVIIGSKNGGVFQTILGAVLVVVGAVATYFGGGIGVGLMKVGAVMMLGGIVQMLSPQATTTSSSSGDSSASYYFSGAVNSSAQGDPVPLAYGRMRVGSKVISAGIYTEDQS
ncbi:tail assembly protein [Paraburkholderia tropica]|uniref:tail assembly protein n=1 Tax=Paraburkholderia tropica TaxID=92647 RepID=UPI002AB15C17|nr:tail assembly protein [Paraburkholderia tropica]